MKVYKTHNGIIIEQDGKFFDIGKKDWDSFINDDTLYTKLQQLLAKGTAVKQPTVEQIVAPIGQQEVWACGVTYLRSKQGWQ